MEFHPYSEIFPLLPDTELATLAESVGKYGLREEIVTWEGKILDGRNRFLACGIAGKTPVFRAYDVDVDGPDVLAFVMDKNFERRQLSASQRAAAGAKYAAALSAAAELRKVSGLKQNADPAKVVPFVPAPGAPEAPPATPPAAETKAGRSVDKAAAKFGVAASTIQAAAGVAEADPEKFKQIEAGTKTVHAAAAETKAAEAEIKAAEAVEDPVLAQYRKDHEAAIRKACGDDFGDAFRDGVLLKTGKEMKEFCELPDGEKSLLKEYIVRGWEVKKASKFVLRSIDPSDPVEHLFLRFVASGKKSETFTVDTYEITIKRKK